MKPKIRVALVGSPNVGKSSVFNCLTGSYATVSNYPGTTVALTRGRGSFAGIPFEVIDTPGIYSLIPITEEEHVTRRLLEENKPDVVVHVVDAKNLQRMLPLTLELMEAGLPVILDLNVMDEAQRLGICIDADKLSAMLRIPVIQTSVLKKQGLGNLKSLIAEFPLQSPLQPEYSEGIEECVALLQARLQGKRGFSARFRALLMLESDPVTLRRISESPDGEQGLAMLKRCREVFTDTREGQVALERQQLADHILKDAVEFHRRGRERIPDALGRLSREIWPGLPLLFLVLYWGLYQFVGKFGAGVLVDFTDKVLFNQYLIPAVRQAVTTYIPYEGVRSLLVGDYGLFTLGVRYAVSIVLPIVGTFFLMFAILEDTGYLPRIALLTDRVFKKFGLNGRAAIPFSLGLGCGTMAVIVTRTLESPRERLLATFLLSLAIPCSAQLGVVLGILSHNGWLVLGWIAYVGCIFILAGLLAARLLPGVSSNFFIEIPPLRLPVFSNIIVKAYTRMACYFSEILPVFLVTSVILWAADFCGILTNFIISLQPVMLWLGLPPETAPVFLLGFFRRDYGAAGFYTMAMNGILNDSQLLVAAITLTLFVPCVAQFMVMIKERGFLISVVMIAVIVCVSLGSGILANQLIRLFIA